jgi:hypothetical protein
MSFSSIIYAGPYIACRSFPIEKKTLVRGCERCKTESDKKYKFCGLCGSQLTEHEIKSLVPKWNSHDIWAWANTDLHRLEEVAHHVNGLSQGERSTMAAKRMSNFYFFIPHRAERIGAQFCAGEVGLFTGNVVAENDVELFRTTFRNEISLLNELFEEQYVDVRWGVISYNIV